MLGKIIIILLIFIIIATTIIACLGMVIDDPEELEYKELENFIKQYEEVNGNAKVCNKKNK